MCEGGVAGDGEEKAGREGRVNALEELQEDEEMRILESIVEFTTHSDQSKVQLKKIATHLGLPISVTRQHLERLRNGLILQENGPFSNPYYSFTIELVRLWLTHNNWFFSPTTEK